MWGNLVNGLSQISLADPAWTVVSIPPSSSRRKAPMWRVIINCSAEGWTQQNKEFLAIAARYPDLSLSTKKMKDDERRIMDGQLEDVDDAETFVAACMELEGFSATFEAS
jgi:hypothetical protein